MSYEQGVPGPAFTGPPVQMPTPSTAQSVVLVSVAVVLAGFVLWGLRDWRARRTPVFLICTVGGFLTIVSEAIVDVLFMVWFPAGETRAYTTFGRPIPLWAAVCYPIVFGLVPFLVLRVYESGGTRRDFWRFVLIGFAINAALEFGFLPTGIYVYYGHQPFRVFHYPLYWVVFNIGGGVLVATILFRARSFFSGWRWPLALLLFPTCQVGFAAGTGWALASALNTHASVLATTGTGLLSVVIGFAVMDGASRLCCDAPQRRNRTSSSRVVSAGEAPIVSSARVHSS